MALKKIIAMTLAELVLVLSIIGIVASLTIPGMKKHSQRSEMSEQLKKSYLALEDLIDNALLTNTPIRYWDFSDEEKFFSEYIKPNMKYTSSSETTLYTLGGGSYTITSCDGTMCLITVDVNGKKAPNTDGKDIYVFQITKSGNDDYYKPESIQPIKGSAGALLRQHNWKFSDNLWNCSPATANQEDGCSY